MAMAMGWIWAPRGGGLLWLLTAGEPARSAYVGQAAQRRLGPSFLSVPEIFRRGEGEDGHSRDEWCGCTTAVRLLVVLHELRYERPVVH